MIQQSEEWFSARLGKVTASRVVDVIAKTKSGFSASRANYMSELIVERLTGVKAEGFTNGAMQWGTEKEPEARMAYSFRADVDVSEIGFVDHPTIPMSGASPDGVISADGLIEIKCPATATHVETILGGSVPAKYITQMQWQLSCTGRQWCDFASYDPRLPESMRLFVKRVQRDDALIADLEKQVSAFLEELDAKLCALRSAYDLPTQLKESAA